MDSLSCWRGAPPVPVLQMEKKRRSGRKKKKKSLKPQICPHVMILWREGHEKNTDWFEGKISLRGSNHPNVLTPPTATTINYTIAWPPSTINHMTTTSRLNLQPWTVSLSLPLWLPFMSKAHVINVHASESRRACAGYGASQLNNTQTKTGVTHRFTAIRTEPGACCDPGATQNKDVGLSRRAREHPCF